ncbi:Uncharacterized protein Fot_20848 [Forsythia ovata]|uniref:Transmembrane protein n=1 Tax=Forsythia ovata TaxID=205694 RepID=A0ABD1UTH0_9LAMI
MKTTELTVVVVVVAKELVIVVSDVVLIEGSGDGKGVRGVICLYACLFDLGLIVERYVFAVFDLLLSGSVFTIWFVLHEIWTSSVPSILQFSANKATEMCNQLGLGVQKTDGFRFF